MRIDDRHIRQNGRPFVIAEVAQAHDGSLGFAHSFIDVAAEAGADAIKFQTHIAAEESTRDEQFRTPFSYEDETRFDYWRRMEFTFEQWQGLAGHAREKDLVFLSSCFSVMAVEWMRRLDVPAWKVGSGEVRTPDLLDAMLDGGEPLLISTGLASEEEISAIADKAGRRGSPFALFQCTSMYPTAIEHVGLNVIDELHQRFGVPVGLSDHSGSIWPGIAAMARGAAMIEVHIAFHERQFGPDTGSSLTPAELARLVEARDAIHTMLSNPVDKEQSLAGNAKTRQLFGKSLALKKP
ncbi:MAG: N-acetylneuraminate synthase family protein, partial [Pirellulales bacterium]|nr:N-acetylneuraminate synthase family protein [Pirellulales bacterium]